MTIHWVCKRQQLQTGETCLEITSVYISICRLTTVLYIAFSFAQLTETFVHKKRLKLFAQANAERCTEWFAFWRLLSNPAGGLKFLISWKVWFSLGMPRLICIPFHHIIWFRNSLSWRAFWLKFAALTRKCRKRASVWCGKLYHKIVWMRLLAFGSHVTSATGVLSRSKRENPGNEVIFARPADRICQVF